LPPQWASLETDAALYQRVCHGLEIPALISMDNHGSCICKKRKWDVTQETVHHKGVVYGLYQATEVLVEMQKCSECPAMRRRYVRPDARDRGILNYNNSSLFTHELLEDYSSNFTTSETPFVTWVTTLTRRYESRCSSKLFVSEDHFHSAWFCYAGLLSLEDDMACIACGPNLKHVIFDGVTISMSKKYLDDDIQPPTHVHPDSLVRKKVKTR
ncbi:hypothetical protein C8J56DRAFT_748228, partial [Mycena floridula]